MINLLYERQVSSMSITPENAQKFDGEPAISCCRKEEGDVIEESALEDPSILPDLVDSGLLQIPTDCLTIGQVLGAKLKKTVDALTPLTAHEVEGFTSKEAAALHNKEETAEAFPPAAGGGRQPSGEFQEGQNLKIYIGEGRDIHLEIPMSAAGYMDTPEAVLPSLAREKKTKKEQKEAGDRPVRQLLQKHFTVTNVEFGAETKLEGTTLYLREDISREALSQSNLVLSMKVDIITPGRYDLYSQTIMDVQPVATKEGDNKLGTGVTRVLDGVVVVVTGTDERGEQIGEFGSSEGALAETIMWGRPGAPDYGDILIKTEAVIKEKMNMERPGPLAVHKVTEYIVQEIREALKRAEDSLVARKNQLIQFRRPGRKKVVIVKEIMGQGAMHDNIILPVEPVGILGGNPNVDLGNLPLVLSPLEVLDGGIHALTCIGPASKETSRHYWREPLVEAVMEDDDLDLAGVVFVGSPQLNAEKFYVSERLGMLVEAMDVDGVFIGTEGFGNNHIDFAIHHEQVGMRGIPVVGLSFCGEQGALVMGNKYMQHMIELNKSEEGIENEILANNTLCPEDAYRAVAMLKAIMGGEEIKPPERKFNPAVKEKNIELIEDQTGLKLELAPNEKSLPRQKGNRQI